MGLPSHNVHLAKQNSAGAYVRRRPEMTLLYQIVREYWPEFQAELANHGKYLPAFVIKEFDEYLKCGRLEHGFLRVRCESCHDENWWHLAVRGAVSVPVVVRDAWPTVQPCW